MKHIYLLFYILFPLFVFSQDLSTDYSIYPKTFGKIAKVTKKSAASPFEFCDTDRDGIVSINLEELKNHVLDNHSSQIDVESGVYIGTSSGEIQLVTNLTTNPSVKKVCSSSSLPIYDIAYNQNGDTYVSFGSNIYKINKADCSIDNVYTFNVISNINSLSFDRQSNIYFGGSSSKVYRLDNGNYNQLNVWKDFVFGNAAGDFVMFGDKMYIAWNNGNCLLYEVTVDNNMNYVSHKVLGNLPNGTYGLASELGSLYGITANQLFRIKINSNSIDNEVILNNNNVFGGQWFGAAGKNEAVAFDVKVYETALDAQNQMNALPSNWNNTIPGGQTIYVVIENTVNQQSEIVPVDIKIGIPPSYTKPKNIEHCESDTNASLFNINGTVSKIIGSQTNVTVSFHKSEIDAINNSNPLPGLYTISGKYEKAYFRVTNPSTGCFSVSSFDLIILSTVFTTPKDFEICDVFPLNFNLRAIEPEIIGNQSDLKVTFYESEPDAINNTNSLPDIYAVNGNTNYVYFRVTNKLTGCSSVSKFGFKKNLRPAFLNPKDIIICQSPNSNYKLDDFDTKIQEILNGQNTTNNIVSFYNSHDDAFNKINGIIFPYYVKKNDNEIFFRIENSLTGCFNVSSFNIKMEITPSYTNPKNIEHCGLDTNAALFNINQTVPEIMGSQTNVIVSFHKSEMDAMNNSNPLPGLYTISGKYEKVYFRVTNPSTGCFSVSSFDLSITQSVVFATPKDIEICDVFPLNFNLRAVEPHIIGNQSNLKVTFYESEPDAINNINSLPDIYAVNSNTNYVYFRVTNVLTGCFSVSKFGFKTNLRPVFSSPKDIVICKSPNSNYKLDDFDTKIQEILNGQNTTNNIVSFYNSHDDAFNKINGIIFPYYVGKNDNEIFFRIENPLTSCFNVSSFFIYLRAESQNANIPFSVKTSDWKSEKNEIEILASGNYEYSMDGLTYQDIPVFKDLLPGEYKVFIRDKDNCSVMSDDVFLMMYRNFFTPNGDGINDYWNVIASAGAANVEIVIYDRYGKIVKSLKGDSIGWDGNYNNNPMPSSDYWFELITEQGKKLKGHFSLKR